MRESAENMLRRWMALDKQLADRGSDTGLNLNEFASKWHVDPKTIRRDLAMFKRLGFPATRMVFEGGIFRWQYLSQQAPMFAVK
jgi:hypothetical protein